MATQMYTVFANVQYEGYEGEYEMARPFAASSDEQAIQFAKELLEADLSVDGGVQSVNTVSIENWDEHGEPKAYGRIFLTNNGNEWLGRVESAQ